MDIKKIAGQILKAVPFAQLFTSFTKTKKDDAIVQNILDETAEVEKFSLTVEVIAQAWKDKGITNEDKVNALAPLAAQAIQAGYANRGKKLKGGQEAELLRLAGIYGANTYDISKLFEDQ